MNKRVIGVRTAQLIATKASTNIDPSFSVVHIRNGSKIFPLGVESSNFWEVDVTYNNSDNTFTVTTLVDGKLSKQEKLSIEETNVVLTVETILFSLSATLV